MDNWKVVEALIRDYGIVAHQVNSFNEFIDVSIPEILKNFKIPQTHEEPIQKVDIDDQKVTKLQISFTNPRLGPPQIENDNEQTIDRMNLIHSCRNQNLTYASPLYVDVNLSILSYIDDNTNKSSAVIETNTATVVLGYIPVMLKSAYCIMSHKTLSNSAEFKECPNDPGGYFIVNGAEKVIIGQERMAGNKIYVLLGKNDTITAEIRCVSQERKGNNIFSLKYIHPAKKVSRAIRATVHFISKKDNIRLILLFYALGITNPDNILRLICYDCSVDSDLYITISNELVDTFEESIDISSQEGALKHISGMLSNDTSAYKKLSEELFPHIGTTSFFFPAKAQLLAHMTRKLLDVAHGRREFDSRDHYGNKRIDYCSNLTTIFRKSLLKITKYVTEEARRQLGKFVNNKTKIPISALFTNCNKTINKDLSYALATGNWGTNSKSGQSKTGISQALSRLNYKSFISHLRRVTTPSGKNSTIAAPRQLHNTQFGLICVTGDTEILLDDGVTIKLIKDLKNTDRVTTVNISDLSTEPSEIKNYFSVMPEKLLKFTTKSGHVIKCTPEHPLLVKDVGFIWKKSGDINGNDKLIIRVSNETFTLIGIDSIQEIEPELVYDFTTISENHSFIANSIVTHNCPSETPEGGSCGFIKNLALGCHLSMRCNFAEEYDHLLTVLQMSPITKENLIPPEFESKDEDEVESFRTNIFVNGACKGFTNDPIKFYLGLKDFKLDGKMPFDVSIFWEGQDIYITSDEGRACRPLFVCEDGYLKITNKEIEMVNGDPEKGGIERWPYLVNNGFVEYVDCHEQENIYVLTHPSEGLKPPEDEDFLPTHTEIDPVLIMGVSACSIAFAEHNPSPRVCYGSSMSKQGEGVPYLNAQSRFDSQGHFLCYPQKPLTPSRPAELLKYSEMSSGQMANVAITCYSGYNQEDACIVNQSAVDRGLFRSFVTRTYVATENKSNTYEETFGRPPISSERNSRDPGRVSKLDVDGLVSPGVPVTIEDLIIGKVSNAPTPEQRKTCNSTRLKFGENGVTDAVLCTMNDKKLKVAKVRVRSYRIPEAGDKLASNFSQKHIISILLHHHDMPFSVSGMVPDIIMNPHSQPSRATVGHLLECLLGKAVALSGENYYGTPFSHLSADEIGKILCKHGYQSKGHEQMYDGYTGKPMKMLIFMGPIFYNRLKHMVFDKIHARARGPTASLTRQPAEGRSRDGGLRFGEMERDAMIGHGASDILHEKLFLSSDNYQVVVCKDCGLMANTNLRTNTSYCEVCKKNNVATVNLPYAAKLLLQEVGAMGIAARIIV